MKGNTRRDIKILSAFWSSLEMIEKYTFEGEKKGVKLLVFAAIHGNETAGTNAIRRLLKEFEAGKIKLCSGCLTLVPVCNAQAYAKDVRQIDENLNRVIKIFEEPKTYEQRLANELCPLIQKHDVLLDLHSTHCEGDVPFAFCDYPDKNNQKLIAGLDVGYVLEGWPQIYAGNCEIEDFSTERAAHDFGKTATTLECGYHKSVEAIEIAYSAIINTLAGFEMIEKEKPAERPKTHILMQGYVVKKKEGRLCKNYKHLDEIKAGEVIAQYDNGEVLTAPNDGFILLPNLRAEIGAEWYYFGIKKS